MDGQGLVTQLHSRLSQFARIMATSRAGMNGQSLHISPICGIQRRQHLDHGLTGQRMAPIGRNLGQRRQNKSAILHAGMGQNQLLGRDAALLIRRQIAPFGLRFRIGQHKITAGDQVQIKWPRLPTHTIRATAPKAGFNPVQLAQQICSCQFAGQNCRCIAIVWP